MRDGWPAPAAAMPSMVPKTRRARMHLTPWLPPATAETLALVSASKLVLPRTPPSRHWHALEHVEASARRAHGELSRAGLQPPDGRPKGARDKVAVEGMPKRALGRRTAKQTVRARPKPGMLSWQARPSSALFPPFPE